MEGKISDVIGQEAYDVIKEKYDAALNAIDELDKALNTDTEL